jgi:hypothetical protein
MIVYFTDTHAPQILLTFDSNCTDTNHKNFGHIMTRVPVLHTSQRRYFSSILACHFPSHFLFRIRFVTMFIDSVSADWFVRVVPLIITVAAFSSMGCMARKLREFLFSPSFPLTPRSSLSSFMHGFSFFLVMWRSDRQVSRGMQL